MQRTKKIDYKHSLCLTDCGETVKKNTYFQFDLFVAQNERKLTPRKKQNKDLTKLTNQTVFILKLTFEAPVLFHIMRGQHSLRSHNHLI